MHDLLRLYAGQLSDARADADRREQARDRLLGYYLDTAQAADAHLRIRILEGVLSLQWWYRAGCLSPTATTPWHGWMPNGPT